MAPPARDASRQTVDFALITPAERVMDELLGLVPSDRVVLAHDSTNAEIARAFQHAALERKARVEMIDLEALAPRPWTQCPKEALGAVLGATATVLAVRYEDGEYDTRAGFVGAAMATRARHVHMVGASKRAFVASMSTPSARIFELLDALSGAVRPSSKLAVRAASGTNVEIELAPHLRWFPNGSVVRAGQWINVPYGALVASPVSVSGVYVADASVSGGLGARLGLLASRPVRLALEGGRVRSVESRDTALRSYVEKFLGDGQNHDRVGLLNLGANLGIVAPIGELIHDEQMPGVHLGLGDPMSAQSGATWTAHGQLSFAMADADVDLDGVPLIRRGRYVRFV